MTKSKRDPQEPDKYHLAISVEKAMSILDLQLANGKQIQIQAEIIGSKADCEYVQKGHRKWHRITYEHLMRIFTAPTLANEFDGSGVQIAVIGSRSLVDHIREIKENIDTDIECLDTIREIVALISPAEPSYKIDDARLSLDDTRVLVIHGHDDAAKEAVARVLERLGLTAIILHEQPNGGMTLIEKLETHSAPGFAVALLTPDDVGGTSPENLHSRARQNVILELGYCTGKLGRDRVMALVKGQIEIPSDFAGVVYTPMDQAGQWKYRLGQELRAIGIEVDLHKIP